nr:hypothetical protein [Tanacetum cinerariifolium]
MQTLEKTKSQIELLDELLTKLVEAISLRERQLVGNVALDLYIKKEEANSHVRVVSPSSGDPQNNSSVQPYRWPTLLFGGRASDGPMPHAWLDDEVEDMNSDDNGCVDINLLITEKDWSKVKRTHDFVEYVYDKYGNTTVIDEMLDDMYNFAMMKEKCLSMVEYEKGKAKLMVESDKGKEKLMVSDEMVEYVLAKKVDDLQNRVERLKGIWLGQSRQSLIRGRQSRQSMILMMLILLMLLILKSESKILNMILVEVVQVSSDEGFSSDEDIVCFNDVKYPLVNAKIRMFKKTPTTSIGPRRQLASTSTRSRGHIASTTSRAPGRQLASTSIRSRASIASTSSAQAATTSAPRVLIVSLCVGTYTTYLP